MKKVGFIDYYLDEWHANQYPKMIHEISEGRLEVAYAYGEIDAPTGRTNAQWAEEMQIELFENAEEVIEKSDYIIILSPNNPERHPHLCKIAENCKKPVYVDKTFAETAEDALSIFKGFDAGNTPCWSASALAFSDELVECPRDGITAINSIGSGFVETYCIHQIEPIVQLLGTAAESVTYFGHEIYPTFEIRFPENKIARFTQCPCTKFSMQLAYSNGTYHNFTVQSPFFERLIQNLVCFFETGQIPISHEQTTAVMAIRSACLKAMGTPFLPVEIRKGE